MNLNEILTDLFLDANDFWTAAGFQKLTREPGAKGTLNVWVKRLSPGPDRPASPFS